MLDFKDEDYRHIQVAIDLTNEAHRDVNRKGCPIPYFTHVMEVYKLLFNYGCRDPEILAAAIMHDLIEDTGVIYDGIVDLFNKRVADYVMECSRIEADGETVSGKLSFMRGFFQKSYGSVQIKIADRVANTMDYFREGREMYAAWYALQAYPLLTVAYHQVDCDYGKRGILRGTDILQQIIESRYGYSKSDLIEKEHEIMGVLRTKPKEEKVFYKPR